MHENPPNGPGYPQQPPYGQRPPRGGKAWPWVLLGCGISALLVILLVFACTAVILSVDSGTAPAPSEPEATEESTGGEEDPGSVGVGEPGTVSQWQVTVNGIETASTYGGQFSQEQAQGEFRIVNMTVENTGSEATVFDSSAISLVDGEGNEYSSNTMLEDESLFLEQINPGNQVSGTVVFDVPEGTEVTEIRVEDMWSFEEPLVIRAE
ncbi:DUF4352 domain-containing protein [Nocardiopsis quinghaiensis]|uniref:DUF4352 domain-containing protein n=1 Tax=Nocardiopsis quinghaiensis TaxID=464995 RepID=UPI001238CA72|nr:DUF4352 domain-containing protein [Nocardiopsis quinghaiensis]